MRTPSPPYCRLDLAPPLADRFIIGVAPIDYGPVLLLMPFGFHLAMDTLPSGVLATALRPARNYPRFWIWRPSSGRQRDFNPPEQRAAQHTICPMLTSAAGSGRFASPSVTNRDTRQISRGKFDRLPCIAAESTFCAFDGNGLRETGPDRPTLTPCIRFLFISSHVFSTLPSDP